MGFPRETDYEELDLPLESAFNFVQRAVLSFQLSWSSIVVH
jgi:hypothetical protein